MRAAIYARVSSEAQANRGTIASQLEVLDAKVAAEGDQLVARRRALREPASLMREARRLGMVRQGERAFVVSNLPRG